MELVLPETSPRYHRCVFLVALAAGAVGYGLFERRSRELEYAASLPVYVRIAVFDGSGRLTGIQPTLRIHRTDDEWRRRLAVDEFQMTRRADTELAFAGAYWNFHEDGLYRCVCCGTALFDSRAKFNSDSGWPSFTEPIAKENVTESPDSSFGMARTAVSCTLCEAHLGHVFDDGPPPTGRRYCMNSVGLKFMARS